MTDKDRGVTLTSLLVYVTLQILVFVMVLFLVRMDTTTESLLTLQDHLMQWGPMVLLLIGIIIVTKTSLDLVRGMLRRIGFSSVIKQESVLMIYQFASYVVWFVIFVFIGIVVFGDMTNIALSFGLLSAALALALQKPLLNLAGWFFIVLSRPYRVGDRVEVGNTKGVVTKITPMHTNLYEFKGWLRGDRFTGRMVAVPNSYVLDMESFNYTLDNDYVWDQVTVSVTYESDHEHAKGLLLEIARKNLGPSLKLDTRILTKHIELKKVRDGIDREPRVYMEFDASAVNMTLVFFTPAERRWETRSMLVEDILSAFGRDEKVTIAYPHLQLVGGRPGN